MKNLVRVMKWFLGSFTQYSGLPKQVYVLAIQRFVNSLGGFVFPFLAMFLSKRLGWEKDQIGLFMMVTAFVGLPGSILSGHLVDRINRKVLIVAPNIISGIIFIICGFLGNSIWIPYLLMASSFAHSFSGPATGAMVSDITTPDNRRQSFSLMYLGMNLGLAFGFMMAGYLFANYTSWLFWGDGLTTILSLMLIIFFITDTKPTREEIDEINESDREGEKEEEGSVFTALIKRPFLIAFVLLNAVVGFVYHQYSFIAPFHLDSLFPGNGEAFFGHTMTLNTVYVILFTPAIMFVTKEVKPIINVAIAVVTYIIGFGMLAFSQTMALFYVSIIIWTTGEIIASVNTGVYISNHSPVNHRGRFNSMINIIQHMGRMTAPFFMGMYLVGHTEEQGWLLTAFIAVLALIGLIALNNTEKRKGIKSLTEETELVA